MNRDCYSQSDLESALAAGDIPVLHASKDVWRYVVEGQAKVIMADTSYAVLRGSSHAVLWGSSHAVLWGSSHAVLWGSSHAVLRESSHAVLRESSHAVLWGSSHAVLRESSHAVLWGSSHAVLRGSSHAVLWGSSHAVLSKFAMAHKFSSRATATGGVVLEIPDLSAVENWLDFWGVENFDGIVTLFKAVDDDFKSEKGMSYKPKARTKPVAKDFNTKNECGGGLHLCAHPRASKGYFSSATKFVACQVKVEDIVPITNSDNTSDKVKVRAVQSCSEITEDGKAI